MDVLQEIKKEHDQFRNLIEKVENSTGNSKKTAFDSLKKELDSHHEAEEQVVFPDVKSKSDEDGKAMVREMIEEHNLVSYQLSLLDRTSLENETWDAKFQVLKEIVTHHLDEEEDEFFKQAKKVLTKAELVEKYEPFEKAQE